jgi:hypothetical protein
MLLVTMAGAYDEQEEVLDGEDVSPAAVAAAVEREGLLAILKVSSSPYSISYGGGCDSENKIPIILFGGGVDGCTVSSVSMLSFGPEECVWVLARVACVTRLATSRSPMTLEVALVVALAVPVAVGSVSTGSPIVADGVCLSSTKPVNELS